MGQVMKDLRDWIDERIHQTDIDYSETHGDVEVVMIIDEGGESEPVQSG